MKGEGIGHTPSETANIYLIDQKKVNDARLTKEIRQLQKESRKRDNKIKSLECDAKKRELVLKRRQDEVFFLSYCIHVIISTCICQLSALRRVKRNVPPAMHQSSVHSSTDSSTSGVGYSVLTAPVSDSTAGYSATVTFRQHHSRNGGKCIVNNVRVSAF